MLAQLKKWTTRILAAAAFLQCIVLPAYAVDTSVRGYDKDQEILTIDITTTSSQKSDFVRNFPKVIVTNTAKRVRPSADLVNQKRREYASVPLYLQNDYPEILYGSGTIETSGCSIVSLAMVASYLTGYEYLPDELAYYFGGRATNNIARLEYGAKTLELPYEKPQNWHYTLDALKAGKCAIVLVDSASKFTESQHFIVLSGITEDEKITVYDPFAPNYGKWDLKDGFENGFNQADIIAGYQGAWVFDKSAMPEEITRYTEAAPESAETRYPDIDLTFAERQLLARVVWVEARGESAEGQQAVAEVVLNRMKSDTFPEALRDVIYEEGQFRSVKFLDDAEPGQAQYQAIEKALYGPYVLPEDVVHFATYAVNDNVWGTIGGHIFCYHHDMDASDEEE